MSDMLVNLQKLPELGPELLKLEATGIVIRRAQPFEITPVCDFVENNFSIAWADEISVGFTNKPVSVYIAVRRQEVVGFAAYECTRRDFFGPMGVAESARECGAGKALLLACLWGLKELGYVYAIIGGAGPTDFYAKVVNAMAIPDSEPGIYQNLLKSE